MRTAGDCGVAAFGPSGVLTAAAAVFAAAAWVLMALAFQPTLRYYGQSALWGLALPAIAIAYMVFTVNSAVQHFQGRGGMWKGRAQAQVSSS